MQFVDRRGIVPTEYMESMTVQGGSLRTWSFNHRVDAAQVYLTTPTSRPLDADIEVWQGPDNTPVKMRVYSEDGTEFPFSTVIETPRGSSLANSVAIRNLGQMEFPMAADVMTDFVDGPSPDCITASLTIQGGALRSYRMDPEVDSVQVLLKTDGRPLNARIELMQGPNNNKQVVELYTEDGLDRPFFCILQTPGASNVVRVVSTSPIEFPLTASVVPNSFNRYESERGGGRSMSRPAGQWDARDNGQRYDSNRYDSNRFGRSGGYSGGPNGNEYDQQRFY